MTPDLSTLDDRTPSQGETILSVRDLEVQFHTEGGIVHAVNGVSFDVSHGETVGLVGESGAGKSVTMTAVMRLLHDSARIVNGTVTYRDQLLIDVEDGQQRSGMLTVSQMRRFIRGNEIAIIFQDPMETLNPVYKVGAQVREFIELNRGLRAEAAKREAIRMLREVGIPEPEKRYHDYPHEFSGGMRQRVLIAMAMGCRPNLIIADEPTTALDVTVEGQILELVRGLQEDYGTSFIWVTHDMGVIAELCDRVNVMYLGEVVEQGPVHEMFYETKHPYTESLLNSIPRPDRTVEALEPIAGIMPEATNPPPGCRFHTRCPHAREACRLDQPPMFSFDAEGHRAACIKHDDEGGQTGYHESDPLVAGDRSIADVRAERGELQ